MDAVFKQQLEAAGRAAPELLLPGCDWVHRRVQRVSYRDRLLTVNSLSVDFTVPDPAPAYLPISVLPKWPPLYRLDFRHSDGTPLPLLTCDQNGVIDLAVLSALVEEVSPTSLQNPGFATALASLARGPETHLEEVFDRFRDGLTGELSDPGVERVLDLAAMLTDATLLWYPTRPAEAGRRTICKVQYLIRNFESERLGVRFLRSLSWFSPAEYIPLWHIGADATFHAELEAPSVLTIRSLEPRYYLFSDSQPTAEGEQASVPEDAPDPAGAESEDLPLDSPDSDSKAAAAVGLRPQQFIDKEGGLAHVYVSGRRPLGADLIATFSASRSTVLSMFSAASIIALLATAFYAWRAQISSPHNLDAAVAILVLVPALIGYVVIRPSDPPIARRYLLGVQLLSLFAAALPLLMAILLLRYGEDPDCLQTAWCWSMIGSWLIALLLGFSFIRAGARAR
jgi:hypothetical protein